MYKKHAPARVTGGCSFLELEGVVGALCLFSFLGVERAVLGVEWWPVSLSSLELLESRSKVGLAFLWVGFNFKSLRKSLRLGDLDGVLANASGADLFDLGVRWEPKFPNFSLCTSVFRTGRLKPFGCRGWEPLLSEEVGRRFGLELWEGVNLRGFGVLSAGDALA